MNETEMKNDVEKVFKKLKKIDYYTKAHREYKLADHILEKYSSPEELDEFGGLFAKYCSTRRISPDLLDRFVSCLSFTHYLRTNHPKRDDENHFVLDEETNEWKEEETA